jgi:nitrite reductase (NAD(P)H)
MSIATFEAEERDDGWVYLKLPPVEELDAALGTSRWAVKKEESANPFEKVDRKLGLNKGLRKGVKMASMTAGANRIVAVSAEKRIDW